MVITKVDNKSPSFSVRTKTSGYQSLSMSCQHHCQNRKAFRVGLQSLPSAGLPSPSDLVPVPAAQLLCLWNAPQRTRHSTQDIPSGEGLKAPKLSFLFSISFIKISMSSCNHEQWSQTVLGYKPSHATYKPVKLAQLVTIPKHQCPHLKNGTIDIKSPK